jgi:hypothetical protein
VTLVIIGGSGAAPVQPAFRQVLSERRSGALQGTVRGDDRRPDDIGGLPSAPAEHIPQDQYGPLPRGEVLDGDQERQLDRLPGDDLLVDGG